MQACLVTPSPARLAVARRPALRHRAAAPCTLRCAPLAGMPSTPQARGDSGRLSALQHSGAASLGCLAALLLACQPAAAASDIFLGVPKIVDGDTMVVAQQRVRLFGIDAPETKQACTSPTGTEYACGQVSKQALEQKVNGTQVACEQKNKDLYGRTVAVCRLVPRAGQRAEDLNAWMVQSGNAVAYRQFSKQYVALEDEARTARRGIWAGSFQEPAQWRKEHNRRGESTSAGGPAASALAPAPAPGKPAAAAAAAAAAPAAAGAQPSGECLIKGNITAKGEKVYHVPGGRVYQSTIIEPAKGERYFCSEQEAVAAGWRASKV